MKKLIYFTNKGLVKAFCGENAEFVEKSYFNDHPEEFKNHIAFCYGLSHYSEARHAKANNIDYIYFDNCFFGTINSYISKAKPKKYFYRVIPNALYIDKIENYNNTRLKNQLSFMKNQCGISNMVKRFKYDGKDILIVPPTGKTLIACNIDSEKWIEEVLIKVKSQGFKNIILRDRLRSRSDRFVNNPIHQSFENAYATITFNSAAATESIMFGVPSFIYDNSKNKDIIKSSALVVSKPDIDDLSKRLFPNNRINWLSTLANYQFSKEEIENGYALKLTLEKMVK